MTGPTRSREPNPKMRIAGAVLVGLAVLAYVGTVTGWDAHGTGGRVAFGVVGTVLLLIGVLLVRTRVPAVRTLHADAAGLTIGLGARPETTLPWSAFDAVWLTQLSPAMGGHMLHLQHVTPPTAATAGLRAFERRDAAGAVVDVIGLDGAQARRMLTQLPAAGQLYLGVRGRTP